ncbi:54S ribosomal protein L4, mitochondrial [Pseudozyma hubeiensis]|nr:54S ribosomal protein L4, mitochondrial [Pseudozyma hubeiensis]
MSSSARAMFGRLTQSLRASPSAAGTSARSFSSSSRASQAPVPVPTKPASQSQPSLAPTPKTQLEQIKQYPAHPLLQFFRTRPYEISDKTLGGTSAYEEESKDSLSPSKFFVRLPHAVSQADLGRSADSRSWLASELRLKSSKDLHTLWYVLLMERNRLATAWEELNRVGARQAARMWSQNLGRKNHRVRKSMARIKFVLNERRLALIEAQKQVREAVPATEAPTGSLFEEGDVQESAEQAEIASSATRPQP